MHIPDGFLDTKTAVVTGMISATGLGVALRQARLTVPPRRVPLLGLAAAFVFAAQMLNFPVAGGTSGHLVGGVLTAALLGPSATVIVISAVLIVQSFLFADGGITALGANIFNMAMIGGVMGGAIYVLVSRLGKGLFGRILAAIFAGWASTVMASIACAGELATSHTISWSVAFPSMTGVHMLIGIGEGLITALVLVGIAKTRPDLMGLTSDTAHNVVGIPSKVIPAQDPISLQYEVAGQQEKIGPLLVYGLLISVGLALFISPLASKWPDGLDKTAETLGFKDKESEHRAVPALAPDYKMPGIGSETIATSLAGAVGTVLVFGMSWAIARALVPKAKKDTKSL